MLVPILHHVAGVNCWSVNLGWRSDGLGVLYAKIPTAEQRPAFWTIKPKTGEAGSMCPRLCGKFMSLLFWGEGAGQDCSGCVAMCMSLLLTMILLLCLTDCARACVCSKCGRQCGDSQRGVGVEEGAI
jgi:hypothetical protein